MLSLLQSILALDIDAIAECIDSGEVSVVGAGWAFALPPESTLYCQSSTDGFAAPANG